MSSRSLDKKKSVRPELVEGRTPFISRGRLTYIPAKGKNRLRLAEVKRTAMIILSISILCAVFFLPSAEAQPENKPAQPAPEQSTEKAEARDCPWTTIFRIGSAEATQDQSKEQPRSLGPGSQLCPGDKMRVGPESTWILKNKNDAILTLGYDAQMDFPKDPNSTPSLVRGEIAVSIPKPATPDSAPVPLELVVGKINFQALSGFGYISNSGDVLAMEWLQGRACVKSMTEADGCLDAGKGMELTFPAQGPVAVNRHNLNEGKITLLVNLKDFIDDAVKKSAQSPQAPENQVSQTPAPEDYVLELLTPEDGELFNRPSIDVVGETLPGVKVDINGKVVAADNRGSFQILLPLRLGENKITVKAPADAEKPLEKTVVVTMDNMPPMLNVTQPLDVFKRGPIITIIGMTEPEVRLYINDTDYSRYVNPDGTFIIPDYDPPASTQRIEFEAIDKAGNRSVTVKRIVN